MIKFWYVRSLIFFALACVCIFVTSQNAAAQESKKDDAEQLVKEPDVIQSVDRIIEVDPGTSDSNIEGRLAGILKSSKKFTNMTVTAEEGLVTIGGETVEEEYIGWASNIATNLEGVVGVINNISLIEPDYLTVEPIKNELLRLWYKGLQTLPLLLLGFLVFAVFFFLSGRLSNFLMKPIGYVADSELIRVVIRRIISLFIILIGLYFFLRIAGLTQFALAVISGTGVMGLILGFAFRDIAENFISSLLISAQRPFRLGDVIQVEGHKGVVRKVTARGTTLVDFDGNHIQIPNATIYKNIVQNFSANPRLRGHFIIGIGYDASITLAQKIAMEVMHKHEAVLDDPDPQILVDQLASSTINMKLYFWIDSETYAVNKVASILMRIVMREFEKNGISMPDDAREIVFPNGVPVNISEQTNAPGEENSATTVDEIEHSKEDLKSDTQDIRDQAEQARDPEEGENIL